MARICGLLAILLVLPSVYAHQDPAPPQLNKLVLGVENQSDYLPYSKYSDGDYSGFNRDLFDLFATHGYQLDYRPLPIKRLYRELLAKRVDLKYPDNAYWSSQLKGDAPIRYSEPVIGFTDGVMVHPANLGRGTAELKQLGVVLGYTPRPYQALIDSGAITVLENPSYDKLLRQVQLGRLDGMYGNIAIARHRTAEIFGTEQGPEFDPDLPAVQSTNHLSSLLHPEIIEAFDRFLAAHQDDIEKLRQQHGLNDRTATR